jgi:glycosyltransferase involved in cell wall biosynthesis
MVQTFDQRGIDQQSTRAVMTPSVLFDQSNTVYRMGTGIATYARNLAAAAQRCGFATQALLSTDIKIDPRDPVLAEVQLFDARREPSLPWLDPIRNAVAGLGRAPFGFRPALLAQSGVVMRSASSAPALGETFVGNRMFEAAAAHFYVYGRLANVRMPTPPALFHATHPLPLRVAGCPNIVTIHDLVPLRLPHMTLDNKRYFFRLIQRLVAQADHVVTVSDYSRRDIMSLFNVPEDRITNTYQAVTVSPRALARSDDEVADEITNLFELDPGNYYLFIGALEPKKNVSRLIDAYAASGSRRPLIVAGGKGWQNEGDLERINDTRFSNYRVGENTISKVKRVRRIPYLPSDQLVTLMRGARALLFPSLFEGFGLPVLEAMTLGTPVLTSNVTSLPEIAGDAALVVDPFDVAAMAAAIKRLDSDVDLLDELSRRGREQARIYSMDNYVSRLAGVYRGILGGLPGGADTQAG